MGDEHPHYGPAATPYLRNVLLGRHPVWPGTSVPFEELGALVTHRQILRPAGALGATSDDIGDPALDEAALALSAWHRSMIARARLFHLSGPLLTHAWACEERFGPCRFDDAFPAPYGFCVLGQPLLVPLSDGSTTPICALAWGPVDDCGFLAAVNGSFTERGDVAQADRRTVFFVDRPSGQWHLRLFTYRSRAPERGRRQMALPEIVEEFDHIVNCNTEADAVAHLGKGNRYAVARMIRIAFMIATARDIGDDRTEPVKASVRKRAARLGADPDQPVRVMGLRPRAARALDRASGHGTGTGLIRRPARYTVPLWERRASFDPVTGERTRKATVCYRDPELLNDTPVDTVYSGTLPRDRKGP